MLVRIREDEGGFRVSLHSSQGDGDVRPAKSLQAAFSLRDYAIKHGSFPQAEPEARKGRKK